MPQDRKTQPTIFNAKATERLRSPDDLDKIVQVPNPNKLVVLGAAAVLLAGLLIWGFLGTSAPNVVVKGAVISGTPMCFVDARSAETLSPGDEAFIGGKAVEVLYVSRLPFSSKEATELVDWPALAPVIVNEGWNYQVIFQGDAADLPERVPLSVQIFPDLKPPILRFIDILNGVDEDDSEILRASHA